MRKRRGSRFTRKACLETCPSAQRKPSGWASQRAWSLGEGPHGNQPARTLGLAGFVAANPEDPQTLPRLHVRRSELTGDYNFLPLAKRVDLDRSFGLMGCSPEWSQVPPKGDRGTRYKVNPWAHMTPYRIQALISWAIDNPNLEPRPEDSEVPVIVGITDNWERHEEGVIVGRKGLRASAPAFGFVPRCCSCACRWIGG